MSLQSALRAKLLADATIAGLVSTRIYASQAPQGSAFPRITLARISGDSTQHIGGESRIASVIMQIGCWGETVDSAEAVSDAVRLEITGIRGTWGSGGNTATVESCHRTNSFDSPEDPIDGSEQLAAVGIVDEYSISYVQTPAT